jgi:hypothetical protein
MAIAFDLGTNGGTDSGTSITFSHTCSGSDRFLVVAVIGDVGAGAEDVTGCTYDGVAMTLADKISDTLIARFGYVFYLVNPASGANNVVASCTGSHFLAAGAASYTGVNQAGNPEVINKTFSNADADASLTTSITPLTADSWVVLGGLGFDGSGGAPSAGTGATRRTYESSFGLWAIYDSNGPQPASSYSMTWSYGQGAGSADLGSIMLAIAPTGGGGGVTRDPAQGALSLAGTTGSLGFTINMPDEV